MTHGAWMHSATMTCILNPPGSVFAKRVVDGQNRARGALLNSLNPDLATAVYVEYGDMPDLISSNSDDEALADVPADLPDLISSSDDDCPGLISESCESSDDDVPVAVHEAVLDDVPDLISSSESSDDDCPDLISSSSESSEDDVPELTSESDES